MLAAREILWALTRKEIKVKYKSSVLGVVWSMLHPVLYLVVFSIVFRLILPGRVPSFPVYLLSGLLAWTLFSTSLSLGARSVVDNANLVTKVYFPREILPFASIGAAVSDLFFQAAVLILFMVVFQVGRLGTNLLLLPLSLLALLVLTSALSLWVAGLNVRYRDTQYLLGLALLAWFWMTPIVYPSALVYERLAGRTVLGIPLLDLYLANPMAAIVMGFQRALYGEVAPVSVVGGEASAAQVLMPVSVGWLAILIGAVAAGSLALLVLAWRTYFHRAGDFAEDLEG